MSARQPSELFGAWSPEGLDLVVEYDLRVLEEIRFLVVDGFNKVPHGGLEVGGVLFGTREAGTVRIAAFRELAVEHRSGPSFTLSEKDEAQLQELLRTPDGDPELAGMEPVGWYHSHTRSEIHLSAADLAVHDRYFPEPWQLALVLKPYKWDPTRAAFFARGTDGVVGNAADPEAFEVKPLRPSEEDSLAEAKADEDEADEDIEIVPAVAALPAAVATPAVVFAPPAAETPRSFLPARAPGAVRRRRMLWRVTAGAAVLLAAALGAASLLRSRSDTPFGIQLADRNGQLLISWDRTAEAVEQAKSARLAIDDGAQGISLELTPEQVRRGSVTYVRNSGSVTVRLRIEPQAGAAVEELASFVGPAVHRAAPASEAEPEPLNISPPQRPAAIPPSPGSAERTVVPEAAATATLEEPARSVPRAFRLPAAPTQRAGRPELLAEAPQIAANPDRVGTLPGLRAPQLPAPAAPAPQTPAPAAQIPVQRSGRMIWTGQLKRRDYLAIDGSQSSTGFVTGQLPLVPVRIRVFPADLTADGLRLYSTDSALAGRHEAAGARNGWNRTEFVLDPRLAGGVRVIESPGPTNGWKRVVLQSSVRDEAAIVIQWETM